MNQTRGLLIAGNWKMNHGLAATAQFFEELGQEFSKSPDLLIKAGANSGKLQVWIIPPTLSLPKAQSLASQLPFPVRIAAQNASWEKSGAFTGEVSGPMLQEIGIQSVLVGHSERRQYFGETDETVRKRTESLLAQGLSVITCIGETKTERETHQTEKVLARQIQEGLPPSAPNPKNFIIAYEPVWAIGTGLTATPEIAEEAHHFIRAQLEKKWGTAASQISILYGGSVTPQNIDSLLSCPNIDGALVGGASLKPDSFFKLVQAAATTLNRS